MIIWSYKNKCLEWKSSDKNIGPVTLIFLLEDNGQWPGPYGKQSILHISILIILDKKWILHFIFDLIECLFCYFFYLRLARLVLLLPGLLFKSEMFHCPISFKNSGTMTMKMYISIWIWISDQNVCIVVLLPTTKWSEGGVLLYIYVFLFAV